VTDTSAVLILLDTSLSSDNITSWKLPQRWSGDARIPGMLGTKGIVNIEPIIAAVFSKVVNHIPQPVFDR